GAGLAVAWIGFSGIRTTRKSTALVVFSALLLLNLASLAFSTAVSARPGLSLFGANWRRYGALIQAVVWIFAWLVAVSCAGKPRSVRTILRGVMVSGAVSAVYGIAQYLGWDPFLPAGAYHVG